MDHIKAAGERRDRSSAIELLRIFAIFGVITLHYNNRSMGGAFAAAAPGSINSYILFFTESAGICSVDLFFLISGFFLSSTQRRSPVKIAGLFWQMLFLRLIGQCAGMLFGGAFTLNSFFACFIPDNYFLILYSVLYILSPYINMALERLDEKGLFRLCAMMMLIFSVWNISADILTQLTGKEWMGLSTIGMYGSQSGYTIVNFALMYVIGAYLQRKSHELRFSPAFPAAAAGCTLLIFGWAVSEQLLFGGQSVSWSYDNPAVILAAVFWFLTFLKLPIRSRIINELAKCVFTCFLIHSVLFRFFGIAQAASSQPYVLLLNLAASIIIIFIFSYIVFCGYRLVMFPVRAVIRHIKNAKADKNR